jgi:predicted Fe-Mo cluster-binding NifX family protein
MMRVAVSVREDSIATVVEERFGRAPFFAVGDPAELKTMVFVANPAADVATGAGIGAAQLLVKLDVEALITGQLGPNALEMLAEAGVRRYRAPAVPLADALAKYRAGQLPELKVQRF